MRERGHSLNDLRRAVREGRLAFGYMEDLVERSERKYTRAQAAEISGLEEELIERIMGLLGTPTALEGTLTEQDVEAMTRITAVLDAGLPLVALLQLIRVYAQSIRKVAEAKVRLFHLYVHEPLIRQGVDALDMAEEMEGLARDLFPLAAPLMEYIHGRYLRFYSSRTSSATWSGARRRAPARPRQMCFCFVDLTGFTRYTAEEGDEEALDLVERFVETVEATLPAEALIVKTIGDEVMIVSPDPVTLTEGRSAPPPMSSTKCPEPADRVCTSAAPSSVMWTTPAPMSTLPTGDGLRARSWARAPSDPARLLPDRLTPRHPLARTDSASPHPQGLPGVVELFTVVAPRPLDD